MDAVALVQDWVTNVGSQTGLLNSSNCSINSGSVGVPESRLELEVEFDSLSELEQFWATIPASEHKAWSEQMQKLVVHGSPTWEIYRTVEPFPGQAAVEGETASSTTQGGPPSLSIPSTGDIDKYGKGAAPSLPKPTSMTKSGLAIVSNEDDVDIVLDWKGDPMKINPGDKIPKIF